MEKRLFIGGEWTNGVVNIPLIAPFSGEKLADIPQATKNEVNLAVDAAYEARSKMASLPAFERANILSKVADLLEENQQECAMMISEETAKPIATAKAEVARTVMTYKFASEEARRIQGETVPMDGAPGGEGRIAYTIRQPLGVIGAITPFNFPMNLVAHKLGPAFAAGNTVVLKPAPQAPLSSFYTAELFEKAGLPKGALNIVTGDGEVGNALVEDDRVSMITFTGSAKVGKMIRSKAGLKRVTLELGSNSAVIIDKEANLDEIIPRAVIGAFTFAGQVCISLQRIYVHETLYDAFVEGFINQTKKLKLGNPLNDATDVSVLISSSEVTRALAWISEAKEQGATVALGGKSEGNILFPTVLLDVKPEMKVSCQEVFAPIVTIEKFSSFSEAIDFVNQSVYGLQAGVYTNDLTNAFYAAEKLDVGGVMINDIPTFRVDHMPYGGVKESGIGKEGIKYAIEDMTQLKLICFKK